MGTFPVLIAHGALGPFDEILLIVAAALFVVVFAAPTVIALARRGRSQGESGEEAPPVAPDASADAPPTGPKTPGSSRRDHYRLD